VTPEVVEAEFVHDGKRQVFTDDQEERHDDVMKPLNSRPLPVNQSINQSEEFFREWVSKSAYIRCT